MITFSPMESENLQIKHWNFYITSASLVYLVKIKNNYNFFLFSPITAHDLENPRQKSFRVCFSNLIAERGNSSSESVKTFQSHDDNYDHIRSAKFARNVNILKMHELNLVLYRNEKNKVIRRQSQFLIFFFL